MKLEGSHLFSAPRDVVWAAFNDPEALARVTPGCQKLEPVGPDEYKAVLQVGVAAIKGTYQGKLAIVDKQPPEAYTLKIEGTGRGGFVKGQGRLSLSEAGTGTQAELTGEAQVGGLIAAVGQRLLEGAGRMMMGQFFSAMEKELGQRAASSPGAPASG